MPTGCVSFFALTVFVLPDRLPIYWQLVVKMMIFGQPWCDLLEDLKSGQGRRVDRENISGSDLQQETFKINHCEYRLLDRNRVVEDPDFTLCGLKVSRRLA